LSTLVCSAAVQQQFTPVVQNQDLDLVAEIASLREQLECITLQTLHEDQIISSKQKEFEELQASMEFASKEFQSKKSKVEELKSTLEQKESALESIEQDIKKMEELIAQMQSEQEELDQKLESTRKEIAQAESQRQKEKNAAFKILRFMKFALAKRKAQREKENNAALKISCFMRLAWAKQKIQIEKEKEKVRREQEAELKRQRNAAINEKGLIRAFCRVKPFLGIDKESQQAKSVIKTQEGSNAIALLNPGSGNRSKAYLLDHVFIPESQQEQVFEQVEDLVDSALDGNHVCLMAYGQTGAGKSYTMEGTKTKPGLIPRASVKLFDGSRAKDGWSLTFKISSFQIYQDEVYDLLVPGTLHCEMRANPKLGLEINGLTKVEVSSPEEILRSFAEAMGRRTTQATAKNATSSRSHLVFKIDVCGKRSGDPNTYGHLYFIDLAGSEALDAGKDEQQIEDGKEIRSSLTALKTFLIRQANHQKGDGRSSNICRYMQFVLGRPEAKLLVIANVSAEEDCFSQTRDALDFVADISKLKKVQAKSPDYIAASQVATEHDKKKNYIDKPWRKLQLEQQQNGRRRRREIKVEFY
jgi:kinesin family member C1